MRFFSFCKRYFTPSLSDSPRNNNFNLIRFVAAFMVIYGHTSALMGVGAFPLFSQAVSSIAVKIFFTISGYLVTKSFLSDSNFARYMIRRSFRIFPALIVVVLASVFIIGPIFTNLGAAGYFSHPGTRYYLLNILLHPVYSLPGVFTTYTYANAVNGSLWTLPVEFVAYLILPPVLVGFKKLGSMKTGVILSTAATLILSVLYLTVFRSARCVIWGSDVFQAIPLLPYFFAGSLFTFPQFRKLLNLQIGLALALVASIARTGNALNEILVFLTVPYLTLSFALCEKPLFSQWFSKCDFSYGLYLWGFPIQQIVCARLARFGLSDWKTAWISFVFVLMIAIPSWYLVEKPMQQLGQKLVGILRERQETKMQAKSEELK